MNKNIRLMGGLLLGMISIMMELLPSENVPVYAPSAPAFEDLPVADQQEYYASQIADQENFTAPIVTIGAGISLIIVSNSNFMFVVVTAGSLVTKPSFDEPYNTLKSS